MIGVIAVSLVVGMLGFGMAFAAGAMIFVVVEEVIPESQLEKNTDIATMGAIVGFIVLAVVLPIFEINQVL